MDGGDVCVGGGAGGVGAGGYGGAGRAAGGAGEEGAPGAGPAVEEKAGRAPPLQGGYRGEEQLQVQVRTEKLNLH